MNLHIKRKRDIMKGKKLLATLAVSAILFTGCGLKSANTIIKVNDTKITQGQFDGSFNKQINNSMFAQMGINMKNGKNTFLTNLIKERVVNELIVRALLEEEMAKRDIKVTNEDVENAIKEIIDNVGSKEQLDAILKQNNVTPSEFKKDLKEQVKIKKLAEQLGNTDISDKEAKDFYTQNIKRFTYPDKVKASHILIAANPAEIREQIVGDTKTKAMTESEINAEVQKRMDEKAAQAKEILADLQKDPTKFAKVAKEKSDDTTTAEKGGELGFFAKEEMVPEFANTAFSLKPNTLSGVVQTQFGYHIIYVTDRMAAGKQPFEKVKNDIKNFVRNQKQLELIDNLVESAKKNATIEYVNSEYDPKNIKGAIQDQINEENKKQEEAAKAQKSAPAEKK